VDAPSLCLYELLKQLPVDAAVREALRACNLHAAYALLRPWSPQYEEARESEAHWPVPNVVYYCAFVGNVAEAFILREGL
jgi:hypothetical protein